MSRKSIQAIEERNLRVTSDKAWETSGTRRSVIAAMTYVVIVVFLKMIQAPLPWLSALVPCVGYLISTLTLPLLKRYWLKRIYRPRAP